MGLKEEMRKGIEDLYRDPKSSQTFANWVEIPSDDPNSRVIGVTNNTGGVAMEIINGKEKAALRLESSTKDGTTRHLALSLNEGGHDHILLRDEESFPDMPALYHSVVAAYHDQDGRLKDELRVLFSNNNRTEGYAVPIHQVFHIPFNIPANWEARHGGKNANIGFRQNVGIHHHSPAVAEPHDERFIHMTLDISSRPIIGKNKLLRRVSFAPIPVRLTLENLSEMIRGRVQDALGE